MKRLISGLVTLCLVAGAPAAVLAAPDHDRWDQHRRYNQHHTWRKGDRFDREDWNRAEAVDWKAHHLHRPKVGYEWRQIDGRFIEYAIATGVIVAIVNGH